MSVIIGTLFLDRDVAVDFFNVIFSGVGAEISRDDNLGELHLIHLHGGALFS